jgi:hypothetical protein
VRQWIAFLALAAVGMLAFSGTASSGGRSIESKSLSGPYKNCTNLNKRYPHGVGRANARDKTSGEPVTTFKRSNRIYRAATSYNGGLDRDKDGIACEKK